MRPAAGKLVPVIQQKRNQHQKEQRKQENLVSRGPAQASQARTSPGSVLQVPELQSDLNTAGNSLPFKETRQRSTHGSQGTERTHNLAYWQAQFPPRTRAAGQKPARILVPNFLPQKGSRFWSLVSIKKRANKTGIINRIINQNSTIHSHLSAKSFPGALTPDDLYGA